MLKTRKFEVLDYLKTEKDIEEYFNVTLEERDYKFLPMALADIARARKAMTSAAKADGERWHRHFDNSTLGFYK